MIKPLTSLHFFFALMVFFSHLSFITSDDIVYNWLKRNVFFEGYLGVSFFFILSGFVLALSYERKFLEKKITKKEFYVARFARIYPLHLITLLAIIPCTFANGSFSLIKIFLQLFLLQSFVPVLEYYYSFNTPSWSISDEAFFYALFPLYIFTFNRWNALKSIFIGFVPILIAAAIFVTPVDYQKTIFYVNPLLRSVDFILGITLFQWYREIRNKKVLSKINFISASMLEILAIILFFIFFILHNYIPRGYRFSVYYWIPMFSIIFIFAFQNGAISKLLSNKILVYLGEISFGFYMIHYLVIEYSLWLVPNHITHNLIFAVILFVVTLAISMISYHFYEKPINKLLKK